jgi:hypothetical protein
MVDVASSSCGYLYLGSADILSVFAFFSGSALERSKSKTSARKASCDARERGWGLLQSIKIYFGDKIGSEASSLLAALNAEPTNRLDIHVAVDSSKN